MKIRVGVTDGNRDFFHRFYTAMKEHYPDEIEVYLFPSLSKVLKAVERFHIRVVLLEPDGLSSSDVPSTGLPKTAYFARLCNQKREEVDWRSSPSPEGGDAFESIPLLCRFRSVAEWHDLIVREASALSEHTDDKAEPEHTLRGVCHGTQADCRVVLFTSAAGGTGTSTAARGFTECCRRHNRHVLYLDFQTLPTPEPKPVEGIYTMEDIILSIRGRRYSPEAVLEQALQQNEGGTLTILPARNPVSLFDLTGEEIVSVLDLVKESKVCSVIVLDLGFDATERMVLPYLNADRTVLVSDGTSIANEKTKLLLSILPMLCTEDLLTLCEKTCLLYNRFQKRCGTLLDTELLEKLGGIGVLDIPDAEDLYAEIAVAPAMERLYGLLTS